MELSQAIGLLDTHLAAVSLCSVTLGRNAEDEYALIVEPSGGLPCSESQLIDIMPASSTWSHILGWHSFVGIPFPAISPQWMAIGVESAIPHPTRGASCVFKAYLFSLPLTQQVSNNLQALAKEICPDISSKYKSGDIVEKKSESIEAHRRTAGEILLSSSNWLHKYPTKPVLFRTIVLLENQLFPRYRHYILGIVSSIKDEFRCPQRALVLASKIPVLRRLAKVGGRRL
jgi:hypothetical protein